MGRYWPYKLLETGMVPELLIRWQIQRFLAQKQRELTLPTAEAQQQAILEFVDELRQCPIAIETDAANEQHYELPPEFFAQVLGPYRKYSSGYWGPGVTTLEEAELAMLGLYDRRAQLADGQVILDLGCGWGALSLWLAGRYPNATIVGLSNSHNQREWIMAEARRRGLDNLQIWTGNLVHFETDWRFDRIVSIELFEHMKNYEALLDKLAGWLKPGGKVFAHLFTHQWAAYHYEDKDGTDWLTRHFFSGGTMPSTHLLTYFQQDLVLEKLWVVDGTHYEKTAEAWWANMQANRAAIWPILQETYGKREARKWWAYWQTFFLACAGLWGYNQGRDWVVSHYRFTLPDE